MNRLRIAWWLGIVAIGVGVALLWKYYGSGPKSTGVRDPIAAAAGKAGSAGDVRKTPTPQRQTSDAPPLSSHGDVLARKPARVEPATGKTVANNPAGGLDMNSIAMVARGNDESSSNRLLAVLSSADDMNLREAAAYALGVCNRSAATVSADMRAQFDREDAIPVRVAIILALADRQWPQAPAFFGDLVLSQEPVAIRKAAANGFAKFDGADLAANVKALADAETEMAVRSALRESYIHITKTLPMIHDDPAHFPKDQNH